MLSEIQNRPHEAVDPFQLPGGLWSYHADFWDQTFAKAALAMLIRALQEEDIRALLPTLLAILDHGLPCWGDTALALSLQSRVAAADRERLEASMESFPEEAARHMAWFFPPRRRLRILGAAARAALAHGIPLGSPGARVVASMLIGSDEPLLAPRALLVEMAQTERWTALRMLVAYRAFIGHVWWPGGVHGVRRAIQCVRRWWH